MLVILRKVVGEVVIPQTVYVECTRDLSKPGARIISEACQNGLLSVHPDSGIALASSNMPMLDKGEISALALALELGEPVLMDERLGRQAAVAHGIAVIGSAGILLAAKQKGVIESVQPILFAWQGMGYFLAPSLLANVLKRAGESPE